MTATAERRWWRRVLAPWTVVLLAGVAAAGLAAVRRDGGEPEPLAVRADGPRFATLAELAGTSALVVRGTVVSTAEGRLVGTGEAAIRSRFVTVRVGDVLLGPPAEGVLLVEEEGWLLDGTPLVVNGLAGSTVGLDAVWFLTPVDGSEPPVWLVVNDQGRYAVGPDGTLTGADGADPLVGLVESLGYAGLVDRLAGVG